LVTANKIHAAALLASEDAAVLHGCLELDTFRQETLGRLDQNQPTQTKIHAGRESHQSITPPTGME
jgi:hypothetical protein